jgi:hypothetical protein
MVVEVIMANGGYLGFYGGFRYDFAEFADSLEFERVRRQAEPVRSQ